MKIKKIRFVDLLTETSVIAKFSNGEEKEITAVKKGVISDNPETRAYLEKFFTRAYLDTNGIRIGLNDMNNRYLEREKQIAAYCANDIIVTDELMHSGRYPWG